MLLVTLYLWPPLQQAGGWWTVGLLCLRGMSSPPLLGWGWGRPGQWDSAVGRQLIGFVRISLPKLAPSQTHPAPGKRALLTSPGPALRTSGYPPGKEGTAGPLVLAPAHPGALCSVQNPCGGRAQPPHQWPLLAASSPPGQVRGPGGACLVTGLDPDHKSGTAWD